MNARFLILLAIAGGIAVYVVVRPPSPPVGAVTSDHPLIPGNEEDAAEIRETKKNLWERPLPGEDPEIPPEFSINVEVDQSKGKNRLVLYVTEANGYYAEYFNYHIWWHEPGVVLDNPRTQSPIFIDHWANRFMKAGEVFRECIEVVPAELYNVDNDIGTSDNWSARVESCNRARVKNPDPLPTVTEIGHCN